MRLKDKLNFIITFGLLLSTLNASDATSSLCRPLSQETLKRIARFVAEKFQLSPDLRVEDQGTVDSTCYRRLSVESARPKLTIPIYLTPDGKYITSQLMDLSHDLVADRRRAMEETSHGLLSSRAPTRGPEKAAVVLVMFSDFQCPFCKELADNLTKVNDTSIRIVFRQFPLNGHDWARLAADASSCGFAQSNAGFWVIHDFLFQNQSSLNRSNVRERLVGVVEHETSMDAARFRACLSGPEPEEVMADLELAQKMHLSETPSLFVNGKFVRGVWSMDDIRRVIQQARIDLAGDES